MKRFIKKDKYWEGTVVVKNHQECLSAAITLDLRDAATKSAIRPAYFDDGYFFLMPGESKEIHFQVDIDKIVDAPILQIGGYNVKLQNILLKGK